MDLDRHLNDSTRGTNPIDSPPASTRSLLKRCGAHHENANGRAAGKKLLDNQTRFDGFSETNLVGQDHAGAELARDPMSNRDLVKEGLDPGIGQSCARIVPERIEEVLR